MGDFNFEINKIIFENFENIKNKEEKEEKIIQTYKFAINKMSEKIKKDFDDNIKNLQKEKDSFKKSNELQIKKVWSKVFNILDNIIEITEESMEAYSKEFNKQAEMENNVTYHAIRTIHARTVLCFKECLLLLKNGYAEGATRIWRTMYELTIIATFIKKHSNDNNIAQRYIDHIVIDNYKEEKEYRTQNKNIQHYSDSAFEKLKKQYNSIVKKYGENFKNDYGWASNILNKEKPALYDLELDIGNTRHKPYYKSSCYAIHGNYKSNIDKIGLIDNNVLLYGPSDFGLSIPCQNIAITLNQMNMEFFTIYFSLNYYVSLYTMNLYLDELLPLANKIQNSIIRNSR